MLVPVAGKMTQHYYVVKILQVTWDILKLHYLKMIPRLSKNKFVYILHKPINYISIQKEKYFKITLKISFFRMNIIFIDV